MPYAFSDTYPARLGILKRGAPLASETRWVSGSRPVMSSTSRTPTRKPTARSSSMSRAMTNCGGAARRRISTRPDAPLDRRAGASAARETPIDARAIQVPHIDERLNGLRTASPMRRWAEPRRRREELHPARPLRRQRTARAKTRDFGRGNAMSKFVHAPKGPVLAGGGRLAHGLRV